MTGIGEAAIPTGPHMPYAGVATFGRAREVTPDGDWRADVGVLGVPFDIALGFRPGARFAPRAIREASLRFAPGPDGFLDIRTGRRRLAGTAFADAGDVVLPALEPDLARKRITDAARAVRSRSRLPVFLGGDHSVSFPLLRAFDDVENLHVVQLDAHLDFTDVRNDTRFSNSSPFRRAVEALPGLVHITTIGLRGLRVDGEALQAARERGHTLIGAPAARFRNRPAASGRAGVRVNRRGRVRSVRMSRYQQPGGGRTGLCDGHAAHSRDRRTQPARGPGPG